MKTESSGARKEFDEFERLSGDECVSQTDYAAAEYFLCVLCLVSCHVFRLDSFLLLFNLSFF